VCGAGKDSFERLAKEPGASAISSKALRVVIIGASAAGLAAAEAARKAAPQAEVTLLSKEHSLPYNRINLTRYLAGEVRREELVIHPENWYRDQQIALHQGSETKFLDLQAKQVELTGGQKLSFDKLILANGAHPFVPPIPGAERKGVLSLRTLEDAEQILDWAKKGGRCVCIGGGLLSLETAGALARRGIEVTVLESFGHLMPRQLDPQAGAMLARHLETIGVKVRWAVRAKEILGTDKATGILLEENCEVLNADLVIIAAGVRSNVYLAKQAKLAVQNGVVVDNFLQSSHPDVFAAGDVAEHQGLLYGNWSVAQFQGSIAGMNAAGGQVEFGGVPRSHTLKVLGLDTFSIGRFLPQDGSFIQVAEEYDGKYCSFVFRDNKLVGANLVGSASLAMAVKKAIENKIDCSKLLGDKSASAIEDFLKTQL
jgi:nitrite reductase (NADH) large subunit